MARKRGSSIQTGLLRESREAALNAVQAFNNPRATFKTETFIVLMIIAWTRLLHAYYRREGVEYRYFKRGPKRRRFTRLKSGAFKYWELAQCLKDGHSPLDAPTRKNLEFLIGLRGEVEHHKSAGVDEHFSGRYLACCLNYERTITRLFGESRSLGPDLTFTLQFRDITATGAPEEALSPLPATVAKYLQEFDAELSDDDLSSPHFRRRFLFVPVVTSKRAQADQAVEFVPLDSELGKTISEKYRILLKDVEKSKYLPKQIVAMMKVEGYPGFRMQNHTVLWQTLKGKDPAKGYAVELGGRWFWYDLWIEVVRGHCAANKDRYAPEVGKAA